MQPLRLQYAHIISSPCYQIAPSAPPGNTDAEVSGPTSLTISWDPPPAGQQNGDVLSYMLSCSPAHVTATYTTAGTWVVEGLQPATAYTCTIHAINANGNGPASTVTERTEDGGRYHTIESRVGL